MTVQWNFYNKAYHSSSASLNLQHPLLNYGKFSARILNSWQNSSISITLFVPNFQQKNGNFCGQVRVTLYMYLLNCMLPSVSQCLTVVLIRPSMNHVGHKSHLWATNFLWYAVGCPCGVPLYLAYVIRCNPPNFKPLRSCYYEWKECQ